MKQVRRGRKEESKLRSAAASQRPPDTDRTFLSRTRGRTNWETLLGGVLTGQHDLEALAADMFWESYAGGISESEWPRQIFSQTLARLQDLPPALLDAKEELPPIDMLPDTQESLKRWLCRLMIVSRREVDFNVLTDGWGGTPSNDKAIDTHVESLFAVRESRRDLFNSLVGGRFSLVIRALQKPTPGVPEGLPELLRRQSLIWCAHDVQMIVARQAIPVEFGSLIQTYSENHTPERSLNEMRRKRKALEEVLNIYFGSKEWRIRELPSPVDSGDPDLKKARNPIVRRLAKAIKLDDKSLPLTGETVHQLMCRIGNALRDPMPSFLQRIGSSPTRNIEAKNFAAEWYDVPSELTAAMVAIRRLVQAEQQIEKIISELTSLRTKADPRSVPGSLPAYPEKPPRGTETRVKMLMNFYRDYIWNESPDERPSYYVGRSRKAEDASLDFLLDVGERLPTDFEGTVEDSRKSFYLLDLIPEHRFAM